MDINLHSLLVPGLLKDYIRELPEPLFTKALFDMMVDGLGVCLLDDAPGKAKLMFSILECLPKINRVSDHRKESVLLSNRLIILNSSPQCYTSWII